MARRLGRIGNRTAVCQKTWPEIMKHSLAMRDIAKAWAEGHMTFAQMKDDIENRMMNIELVIEEARREYDQARETILPVQSTENQ